MGHRLTACLLLLVALFATAPPAAAAGKFELLPRIRVEEEYNDNVFLLAANKKADFITTFYPGLNLAARTPSSGVELDYELGYSYYYNLNTDFVRHALGLRAYEAVSPHLSIEAVDTFYRSEDLIEPGLGTLAPRQILLPYTRNMATPRVSYRYAPESDVTVAYTNILLKNDSPAVQDSYGNRIGFEVHHALNRHNHLEIGYSFESGRFTWVPTTTFLVLPNLTANRANLGYTYQFSRRLSLIGVYAFEDIGFQGNTVPNYLTHESRAGFAYTFAPGYSATVTGGYYLLDRQRASSKGGPAVDVLVQKVMERGVLNAGFRQGLSEDFYSGENLGVFKYWLASTGFTYFLEQHLNAAVGAQYGRRHFPLVDREDDFWSVDAGLVYRLRKWLEAGVRYERLYLLSKPGPFDFSDNRYVATIGATY
jgi:hypothetical protein